MAIKLNLSWFLATIYVAYASLILLKAYMKRRTSTHDTLVVRLAQMLVKLNQGEKLDPVSLAQEFGVNRRTIQRDLNERFTYLPLVKTNGKYHLDDNYLGKLNTKDIEKFATMAGVKGLFPNLSDQFLNDVFSADEKSLPSFIVKGHDYEDLTDKEPLFKDLKLAIQNHQYLEVLYEKNHELASYRQVLPYKLINHKGVWYLAAVEQEKMKTFSITKMRTVHLKQETFIPDKNKVLELTQSDGIFFGSNQLKIKLRVEQNIASYFKRRKLLPNQQIERELEDGSLIVTAQSANEFHMLAIVRYWIPFVRILSPQSSIVKNEQILKGYLEE